MVTQPTLGKFVRTFETKAWLVREGFTITNKNHMELLFEIVGSAGIPMPVAVEESLDTISLTNHDAPLPIKPVVDPSLQLNPSRHQVPVLLVRDVREAG